MYIQQRTTIWICIAMHRSRMPPFPHVKICGTEPKVDEAELPSMTRGCKSGRELMQEFSTPLPLFKDYCRISERVEAWTV